MPTRKTMRGRSRFSWRHYRLARDFWNPQTYQRLAPTAVSVDSRPGALATDFWWTGDGEQVGAFWHAYTSAWMTASLLKPENQARFVDAWFAASRHWGVTLHFNKGLGGGISLRRLRPRGTRR